MKMKKQEVSRKVPFGTKRKLIITVAMLLVACTVLTAVSFAWLILSTAPEATGIVTAIGSNGSLEIALLNSATKLDPSTVPTVVGGSLQNTVEGNYSWGNLVDLSDESFGLANIKLLPARLNATKAEDGYALDSRSLYVPTYSYDGRIVSLDSNSILTATYKNGVFKTAAEGMDYGVRAIGTSNTVSAQAGALALARSQVVVQTNNAKSSAINAMKNNDSAIFNIMIKYQTNGAAATFDDTDLNGLKDMIADLKVSVDYIDLALRQGIIAYAASTISDEDQFNLAEDAISNKTKTIEEILDQYGIEAPQELSGALSAYYDLSNKVNNASNQANALVGGVYEWAQISPIFKDLINIEGDVFINDNRLSDMSADDLTGLIGSDVRMTLAGTSGVFSDIANFTDDYSTFIDLIGETQVSVMGDSNLEYAYLVALAAAVSTLTPADGSDANLVAELTSTYGYILDLAFRCNAPASDLILQTDPTQRVYEESNSPSTIGGGSYMEFPLSDHFSLEQSIKLIDAVRVAFVDDHNNILGIAKLNTSNYTNEDGILKAPLFLYDYSLSENPITAGALIMGERKKDNNIITPLVQNEAMAVSVVVWLDGDTVDNTMVSAESEHSISGTLNLQFASSADLVPANNGSLMDMVPDKESLKALIDNNTATYEAGQGIYTTSSWNDFVKAYEYAEKIYADSMANEISIARAMKNLTVAKANLSETTVATLMDAIEFYRELMGQTEEVARYVVKEGEKYKAVNPYNVLQLDAKVHDIMAVDSNNNMHDEGNDIYTPVYTDESWEALADALYNAELVQWTFSENLVEENTVDIDNAISGLELAFKALARKIFYEPYDYEGSLYYRAVTDDSDTYGKWYTYDFKRVVADLRIIELDRYAEPISLVTIEIPSYIENSRDVSGDAGEGRTDFLRLVSGTVSFNTALYSVLQNETICYFTATDIGMATRAITQSQKQILSAYIADLNAITDAPNTAQRDALIVAANALIDNTRTGRLSFTYAEASKVIYEIEVFLAEDNEAIREQMRVDLNNTAKLALVAARAITQTPVLDNDGVDISEEYYKSLNDAIVSGEALMASASIEETTPVFDALNAALVSHAQAAVPYPTYELANSAAGDKPMYYAGDTLDLLIPYPTTDDSWKISIGDVFVVTSNGIIVHAEPKVMSIYEKADGVDIVSQSIVAGTATTLDAELFYLDADNMSKLDTLPLSPEHIVEYTWASSNTDYLAFENGTAIAKAAGTVEVSVSVKTREGNTYTAKANISVVAPTP